MNLNTITISAETNNPEGLIVFLHGWGANAEDLASLTPLLRLTQYQFIFPDAPFPHPQVPLGRAWYSLETQEYKGLDQSRQTLIDWLTSLEATTGIPASRTILGGFSQGGAMTMDVGRELGLAGLIVLSGYLHFSPEPVSGSFPPMLIVHGRLDRVVPLTAAIRARDRFQELGADIQYHEFDMAHEIRPEVLSLIRSFVVEVMSKSA
ncbi:MAG: alpha/beta hydrolase [Limnoraphis robusta]|uniref:Serine esterase n=2 Tax=Limnoraphis robusta TaxID=1118279 RepID=A0A0F5YKQ7_9CYAN|nr:alpha/beta hydrolase [Limnoraphis robusta]KKD39476.1 serine esterase [Limnoraphis robusta CS-951]KMW70098.1 serine esterase [Limnoraphis robusta CS-951]MEA5521194.1 alpha/beta hydrolase [Limnoraphis robusta CCNP1315]MEA5546656.1 alpha/beta hydrolase [Limnoraphis robusta CCNP1324]